MFFSSHLVLMMSVFLPFFMWSWTTGVGAARHVPKPGILKSGICVTNPERPCCAAAIERHRKYQQGLLSPPAKDFLAYPGCMFDGYYGMLQMTENSQYCVDKYGNRMKGILNGKKVDKAGFYDIHFYCERPDGKLRVLADLFTKH